MLDVNLYEKNLAYLNSVICLFALTKMPCVCWCQTCLVFRQRNHLQHSVALCLVRRCWRQNRSKIFICGLLSTETYSCPCDVWSTPSRDKSKGSVSLNLYILPLNQLRNAYLHLLLPQEWAAPERPLIDLCFGNVCACWCTNLTSLWPHT